MVAGVVVLVWTTETIETIVVVVAINVHQVGCVMRQNAFKLARPSRPDATIAVSTSKTTTITAVRVATNAHQVRCVSTAPVMLPV